MTTKHATCTHPTTPAARKACRAGRKVETVAAPIEATPEVRGCDYCGGAQISLEEGYAHTRDTCPAFGSHFVLRTQEELVNVVMNMRDKGYDIKPRVITALPTMPHRLLVNLIIKLIKTQG